MIKQLQPTPFKLELSNNILWEKEIKEFIRNLDRQENTKLTYEKALREWIRFIQCNNTTDQHIVLRYKEHLMEKDYSANTVCVYLTALRTFFDCLVNSRKLPYNPASSIRGLKKRKSRRDALTKDEALKLINLDFKNNVEELRNKALLFLKLFTGLRDISLIHADVSDLKVKEGKYVLYYVSKGEIEKNDFVVLDNMVYQTINDYLVMRGNTDQNEALFASCSNRNRAGRLTTQSLRLVINILFKRVGIIRQEISPHSLRHTAITLSILGGADINQAKEMASHRSIESTAGYFKDVRRLSDPAEAYIGKYLGIA